MQAAGPPPVDPAVQLANMQAHIHQQEQQIQQANRQIAAVTAEANARVAQLKASVESRQRPKIPAPSKFGGESGSAIDEWIHSIEKQFE